MKKILCMLLVLVSLSAALMPTVFAAATFSVVNENGGFFTTPSVEQGTKLTVNIGVNITGWSGTNELKADVVSSTDTTTFPFKVGEANQKKTLTKKTIDSSSIYIYNFSMTCHEEATTGYYTINLVIVEVDDVTKAETSLGQVSFIVEVKEKAYTPPTSMPRITITAFSTSPDPVVAGEEITLSVTFTNNTSGVTAKNVKAQLSSDGTFTPVSGSSSMFLGNIGGSSSIRKSIKLKVKADVAPNSYNVTFDLTYDVSGVEGQMSDSETVSIPVVQVPKMQVSNPQMYPEEVYTGQDMNFMAALNNTGRSALYNVNVVFEDTSGCIEGLEQYIGNIEPGETKNIDVYLSAVMEGESLLTMTITYEDQDGEIYTFTESYSVYVMVRGDVDPMPWPEEQEGNKGSWVWLIIVGIVLLAAAGLVAFILINRKKKAEQSKQLDQQQIAQLEWAYNQQNMQGADYTADAGMAATAEIPKDFAGEDNNADDYAAAIDRYNRQPAGMPYFVDTDTTATTDIPISELETGVFVQQEPERAEISEAEQKKNKKTKADRKKKIVFKNKIEEPEQAASGGESAAQGLEAGENVEKTEQGGTNEDVTV